jgi:hypothetical protein
VSESTFRRYVGTHVREGARRERTTVRKEVTAPGQAEVDYERLGRWTEPRTGKRHVVYGFVMTLASSRLHFVEVVLSCDQSSWVASHVAAFEFFAGRARNVRQWSPRGPRRPATLLASGPAVRSIGRRFQPGAHPEGYAVAAMSPLPLRRRPSTVSTVALPLPRCPSKPVW